MIDAWIAIQTNLSRYRTLRDLYGENRISVYTRAHRFRRDLAVDEFAENNPAVPALYNVFRIDKWECVTKKYQVFATSGIEAVSQIPGHKLRSRFEFKVYKDRT